MNDDQVGKILIEQHYLSAEEIEAAKLQAQKERKGLADVLMTSGLLTRDLLGQAIAEHSKLNYADLNTNTPAPELVLKIPESIAQKYRVVAFKEAGKTLTLATDNTAIKTAELSAALSEALPGAKVKIAYSLPDDIDEMLLTYKQHTSERFDKIIRTNEQVAPKLFEEIIQDVLAIKSSDVHLEPSEEDIVLRYRVDGVLQEIARLPRSHYETLLNLIKIQANLRIDEHFAAQDGSIRYVTKSKQEVDMRVSIAPTLTGEKAAIRILSNYVKNLALKDLGLSKRNQELIAAAAHKPFGMILVSGPTGSGKTTTLYALLNDINNTEVNITTIEDPVEYRIKGTNQIQVNPRTNLTFAKGLRTIVRQDPDVILVGEIRDTETAEIATNAALTGHLLLSTFHANDAATTIPRLLDMGVEPFLLSSTLQVVMAQRLVRKLCEKCRTSAQVTKTQLVKDYPQLKGVKTDLKTLYNAKGCSTCKQTGYRGRIGIFEVINIDDEMQELILKGPSAGEVWKLAEKAGTVPMFEDGMQKVETGITTIAELLRVATPK